MTNRLLIGAGKLMSTVVASMQKQPGQLQVCTTDEALAESLQGSVTTAEEVTEQLLRSFGQMDIVGVFNKDSTANREHAETVRTVFPDATLVVYTGGGSDEQLESVADIVVDPTNEVAQQITDRVGEAGQRMQQLQRVLRDIDRLAVVAHDNPDPDAIASGIALARLGRAAGCETEVCYYGEITHQENRAFINVLEISLRNLDPGDDLSEFDGLALVDHSRPGVNDQLSPDSSVDIVIDHHPPRAPIDARFVDLRSGVGATSTLLVDYLDQFNLGFDEAIATALLFGIHVDTDGFSREVSQQDFTAAATLSPNANFGTLERIESPSISQQTYETIARAIRNRQIEGQVLLSCVGQLTERDALAQAADRLLALEGVSTTLVYGIKDGQIFVSARSRGSNINIGESLREAFGQIGSAGGHVDMAGAQIELGFLDAVDAGDESLVAVVESVVRSRFLDVLENQIEPPTGTVYASDTPLDEEYFASYGSESDTEETDSDDQ